MREKEMYILHSKLKSYKKRIDKAKKTIEDALKLGNKWILSFSGGKDSCVMLDIACKCGYKGDLLHFFYSEYENTEENQMILKKYAEQYNLTLNEIKCMSCKDMWDEVGYYFDVANTPVEKQLQAKAEQDYKTKATEFCKSGGYDVLFMGIRKNESKMRQIAIAVHGTIYYAKCREMITCCPISDLTDEDIWAYIFANDLPYLSVYDNPYFDRRKTRNELEFSGTALRKSVGYGVFDGYNLLYPEIIAEIKKNTILILDNKVCYCKKVSGGC